MVEWVGVEPTMTSVLLYRLLTAPYNGVGGWIRTSEPRRTGFLAGTWVKPLPHTDIYANL